jgi:flagellar hook-associated protein 2
MSTTPAPSFSGTSKYASSLQQVITRAVGIASLPLQSDYSVANTLSSRQTALQSLDAKFSSLQASIASLQRTASSGNLNSRISDGSVVSASVDSTAGTGVYSIEVTSLGAYSSALSAAGTSAVSDPKTQGIASSTSLTLTTGGTSTTITPSSSSLQDLASAINSQAGDQVQATLINVGTSTAADYRLSLRAVKLGGLAIGLTGAGGANLISSSTTGQLAAYKVAGLATPISSDSRTVSLAFGLTVNLLSQSADGVATTITVSHDSSPLEASLQSFAASYNAAADELAQYHGQSAGVLQGDSIVTELTNLLRSLGNYGQGTPSTALANFGISLGKDGHLSVDSSAFTQAADSNFTGLISTLGDSSSGGFLKSATDLLNGVEEATNGTIKVETSTLADEITAQNKKISDQQARITQFQDDLTQRMAKADTTISSLESQVSYVNGLFYAITGNNNGTGTPTA